MVFKFRRRPHREERSSAAEGTWFPRKGGPSLAWAYPEVPKGDLPQGVKATVTVTATVTALTRTLLLNVCSWSKHRNTFSPFQGQ